MNQNWKRFICTALVLILAFMGPMVDSSLLGKYIKSDTTQVLATTAKEKKKQAEDDLENTNNKINDIKDQKATVDSSIKSKSDELDTVLAAQKKLQTDIADKQSQIEDNMEMCIRDRCQSGCVRSWRIRCCGNAPDIRGCSGV